MINCILLDAHPDILLLDSIFTQGIDSSQLARGLMDKTGGRYPPRRDSPQSASLLRHNERDIVAQNHPTAFPSTRGLVFEIPFSELSNTERTFVRHYYSYFVNRAVFMKKGQEFF
jgi:hypothetical protein